MSTRDELARALAICDDYDGCFERVDEWEATPEDERHDDNYPASDYEDCQWWLRRADAALELLRPRVVETIDQLEALPEGSVIHDGESCICERDDNGWLITGSRNSYSHHDIVLPATVLHLPGRP